MIDVIQFVLIGALFVVCFLQYLVVQAISEIVKINSHMINRLMSMFENYLKDND